MNDQSGLSEHFSRLGVEPGCAPRDLERAFHRLAKLYHPDNAATADLDEFAAVVAAYKALRSAAAQQDDSAHENEGDRDALPRDRTGPRQDAADDADAHMHILARLYRQRRDQPGNPGVGSWELEELVGCTPTQFEFHAWYLRAKRLVEPTESGTLAITIEGVDHVIATAKSERARLLLEHTQPRLGGKDATDGEA